MNNWIKAGMVTMVISFVCISLSLSALVVTIGQCLVNGYATVSCAEVTNSRFPFFGMVMPFAAIVFSQVALLLRRKGKSVLASTQP